MASGKARLKNTLCGFILFFFTVYGLRAATALMTSAAKAQVLDFIKHRSSGNVFDTSTTGALVQDGGALKDIFPVLDETRNGVPETVLYNTVAAAALSSGVPDDHMPYTMNVPML